MKRRILPLFTLEPSGPLQVYMTLQLLSTQAIEFCSAASVCAYKASLLPGSQQCDAKFRSLRKKALSNRLSLSLLTNHVNDIRPQQHFMWQHPGIYFCLPFEETKISI